MKSAATSVASAASQAVMVDGIQVLAQRVDSLDRGQLRTLVDNLRNKLGSGVVVLGSAQEDGKVALITGVTKDLTGRLSAGKIIAPLAQKVGGSGGGRPDMAEAGGKDASALNAALASAPEVVRELLGRLPLASKLPVTNIGCPLSRSSLARRGAPDVPWQVEIPTSLSLLLATCQPIIGLALACGCRVRFAIMLLAARLLRAFCSRSRMTPAWQARAACGLLLLSSVSLPAHQPSRLSPYERAQQLHGALEARPETQRTRAAYDRVLDAYRAVYLLRPRITQSRCQRAWRSPSC